ncbi:MAG: hypothetical protein GF308_08130 [Candidatus Heimdallarchaeota archaeon]|nr:hypothetical protein [Candidatus Heimdallarchaeota archaeon]
MTEKKCWFNFGRFIILLCSTSIIGCFLGFTIVPVIFDWAIWFGVILLIIGILVFSWTFAHECEGEAKEEKTYKVRRESLVIEKWSIEEEE